jgi:hypothetical protein
MNSPETSDLIQTLHRLPKLPLAEDVDADLLLVYRDQMLEEGDGRPNSLVYYAWNDLELGFSLRDKAFVDAAFDTFREVEGLSADLTRQPYLDVRMVLAAEIPLRHRLEATPMGKKKVTQAYHQVGTVINACLEFDSLGVNTDRLAELIAYGSLARSKNAENFPYFGSPREKFGGKWIDSHNFYNLSWTEAAREKEALRVMRRAPRDEPAVGESVRMVYMMPAVYQAIWSQGESWVREMAGNSGRTACEERWLRYVGSQLVRESRGDHLKPEAERVLDFMTAALQGQIVIATDAESESGLKPKRAPEQESKRRGTPIPNTALADQLREKFGIVPENDT